MWDAQWRCACKVLPLLLIFLWPPQIGPTFQVLHSIWNFITLRLHCAKCISSTKTQIFRPRSSLQLGDIKISEISTTTPRKYHHVFRIEVLSLLPVWVNQSVCNLLTRNSASDIDVENIRRVRKMSRLKKYALQSLKGTKLRVQRMYYSQPDCSGKKTSRTPTVKPNLFILSI